ncbi:MAG: hypothetical protein ACK56I_34795, partial [bacterium]
KYTNPKKKATTVSDAGGDGTGLLLPPQGENECSAAPSTAESTVPSMTTVAPVPVSVPTSLSASVPVSTQASKMIAQLASHNTGPLAASVPATPAAVVACTNNVKRSSPRIANSVKR